MIQPTAQNHQKQEMKNQKKNQKTRPAFHSCTPNSKMDFWPSLPLHLSSSSLPLSSPSPFARPIFTRPLPCVLFLSMVTTTVTITKTSPSSHGLTLAAASFDLSSGHGEPCNLYPVIFKGFFGNTQ